MSNSPAIATVTAVLQKVLAEALENDAAVVGGHAVTMDRPDGPSHGAEVRVYLYQVLPNAAGRNTDLPSRRADGTLVARPALALDLHYLISFFGKESDLEPQRLLGSVARTLHAQPVLSRETISKLAQADDSPDWLKASTLADQVDLVRFTPLPLTLEDLSKLWSVFFQTKYTLSVAYQASAVIIESDAVAPEPAVPVRERHVDVVPVRRPAIEHTPRRVRP